ncbi:MAG: ROK family protein [Opitutaceae bacterium]|nr:ROK family protein [Opitutaceae bacterium]
MKILGIDIGGSAVKGAPVDTRTGRLVAPRHRIATDKKLSPKEMAATIKRLAAHFDWAGPIGVGFPGVVHGPRILTSANLHKDFCDCDVVRLFGKATGCPVALINDADAAGMAEIRFGAGRDITGTVLLLTLGTGVGSALFCNGRLFPNSELGHLPIRGKSAERFVSSAAKDRRDLDYKEWGKELRDYIRVLEKILWPERIIIGGGVSKNHAKFFKYIKPRAQLVPAEFFNEAGIVGAAMWAAEQQRKR